MDGSSLSVPKYCAYIYLKNNSGGTCAKPKDTKPPHRSTVRLRLLLFLLNLINPFSTGSLETNFNKNDLSHFSASAKHFYYSMNHLSFFIRVALNTQLIVRGVKRSHLVKFYVLCRNGAKPVNPMGQDRLLSLTPSPKVVDSNTNVCSLYDRQPWPSHWWHTNQRKLLWIKASAK